MSSRLCGMYVHMHWGYNHPYAARTWNLEDYRGYMDGLKRLGFNMLQIWPVIDTMPLPLTRSDREHLENMRQVIDAARREFGFRVVICACANVLGNEKAKDYEFQSRPYFVAERLVNPGDPQDVDKLISARREFVEPLREADGFCIIDSDPGGYAGSSSEEFVQLMVAHRRMLDSLRPGMELVYWMWHGWQREGPREGNWKNHTHETWHDAIRGLVRENPEPWRVYACCRGHSEVLRECGQLHRALYFPYGAIEGEPTIPLTNWNAGDDGELARAFGDVPADMYPVGAMGNSQSHCLQLPHLYLFKHLTDGKTAESADLPGFAARLYPAAADKIANGWMALHSQHPESMEQARDELAGLDLGDLQTGDMAGLLFGDPRRLPEDLICQLNVMAPLERATTRKGRERRLAEFGKALSAWQRRTGFNDRPSSNRIVDILRTVCPEVLEALGAVRFGAMEELLRALDQLLGIPSRGS